MVSGIDSNYFDLGNIKQELELIDTSSDGKVTADQKETLNPDINYFLDNIGDNTNVDLTLTEVNKMLEAQASKEVAPDMDMDLDLDISSIPDAGTMNKK